MIPENDGLRVESIYCNQLDRTQLPFLATQSCLELAKSTCLIMEFHPHGGWPRDFVLKSQE